VEGAEVLTHLSRLYLLYFKIIFFEKMKIELHLKYIRILLLTVVFSGILTAQKVELFPGDLNIQPFTSNFLEPRMGVFFQSGKNDLRLDIGASKDIARFTGNNGTLFSIGADFFTYTRLRGEADFHFPVDAVDYLFGLNAGYKIPLKGRSEFGIRARLSHISAHFVDGHYDGSSQRWRDNRNPLVYSREFVELFPYYRSGDGRIYLGITYLFHVDPTEIEPWIIQAGFDTYPSSLSFGNIYPFVSYDYKMGYTTAYNSNHTAQIGLKFGKPFGSGLRVVFTLFSGKNVHGEYYEIDDEHFSTGVTIDF
jgi:hypothetical protein